MYKLSIDAMSGDLGSSIVVEACEMFMKNHHDVELYVTGKKEELETLTKYEMPEVDKQRLEKKRL